MFKRLLPLFWAVLTVGVVGGVVWYGLKQLGGLNTTLNTNNAPPPATGPKMLRTGQDYYVLVKLIEFNTREPDGSDWDRGGGSAPDAKVLMTWHGQQVFALPQRTDELISTWDLFRVNIKDIALSGGNVDIASAINAPIVRVEPGEKLTVEVYDSDLMQDDLALRVKLQLDELHEGENNIPPPRGSGVRRLVVQALSRETSLSDLIALASKR